MKTISIQLPDNISMDEKEARMILACKLYEKGEITSGEGAEIAGLSRREFIENMGKYGVSVFNFPSSEIVNDSRNAARYHR